MQVTTDVPLAAGVGPSTARSPWLRSRTERQWLTSFLILVASVAFATAIYTLENRVGRWSPGLRLVRSPTETVMRLFGMSHVLVATLYLLTSRSMRSVRGQAWLGGTLALGVALCLGFHRLNGLSPAIASALFLLYFAAHDLRDEVYFYFEHGEAPGEMDRHALAAVLFWLPMSILLIAAAGVIGIAATGLPGSEELRHLAIHLPAVWRWSLSVIVMAAAATSMLRMGRAWRRLGGGSAASFVRANRPMVAVLAGTFTLVMLGALPGWNAQLLVGLHVIAWYVFTLRRLRRLRRDPSQPRPWTWAWLRGTPAGFNLLHLGSLTLLVAGGVVWAYGFRSDPKVVPLWLALDPDLFPGWTLLHVTLSFRPR